MIDWHGKTIVGIIVESGNFDWEKSLKFSWLVGLNPSYYRVNFYKALGAVVFVTYIRAIMLHDMGAVISPISAFLLFLGTETLSLRVE